MIKKLPIAFVVLLAYIGIAVYYDFTVGPFLLWLAAVCMFCGVLAIIVMPLPDYYENPNDD